MSTHAPHSLLPGALTLRSTPAVQFFRTSHRSHAQLPAVEKAASAAHVSAPHGAQLKSRAAVASTRTSPLPQVGRSDHVWHALSSSVSLNVESVQGEHE